MQLGNSVMDRYVKGIWEYILDYGEKGNILDKNKKEASCEAAMCCLTSSHSVNLLFLLSSFLTLFMFSV